MRCAVGTLTRSSGGCGYSICGPIASMSSPGTSTFLAQGGNLAAGASETLSADLKPGSYELVCHLAGHYAAGQKLPFKVE